jgi:hypothetical protein
MVPVERPMTNEKFASREKIRKWKTGISAVIAEIVMQEIEAIAINTLPVPVRWWRRYVDDSNSCLRKNDIEQFHTHLNTINNNIQFTIELPESYQNQIAVKKFLSLIPTLQFLKTIPD